MPPSTTPARTRIVSRSAKSGVTSGFCTVSITATTPRAGPRSARRRRSPGPPARRAAQPYESPSRPHACAARRACDRAAGRGPAGTRRPAPSRRSRSCGCLRREIVTGWFKRRERRGDLPERAEPEQCDALQQERDRECRDEHHGRRLRAQRPEHDPVHEQREHEHDREAEDDARRRRANRARRRRRARTRRPSPAVRRRS